MTETHLVLIGFLLVADRQVRRVDIQVDVTVTSDAPATLASSRHPLELHLDVMALLPLLARRGQAEDTAIHIHCPQQGCWHGCTNNLERICVKAQRFVYNLFSLSVRLFHSVSFIKALLSIISVSSAHPHLKRNRPNVKKHRSILAVIFVDFCSIYCARCTTISSISWSIESRWDRKVKQLIVLSAIASADSQYSARIFLLKRASRVTTIIILFYYITTLIYHHCNNKTNAVLDSIKGV